jgi:hypothetical protein
VRSDASRKRSETLPISAPQDAVTFVDLVLVKTAFFRNAERFHSTQLTEESPSCRMLRVLSFA